VHVGQPAGDNIHDRERYALKQIAATFHCEGLTIGRRFLLAGLINSTAATNRVLLRRSALDLKHVLPRAVKSDGA